MIQKKIAELKQQLKLYEVIQADYVAGKMQVVNMATDAVYEDFCERHPDLRIPQQRFTRIVCDELGMKSKQCWLGGIRRCVYERA